MIKPTEFELIARLCKDLPVNPALLVGPGDDCAVLDVGIPGELLLLKTDAVVEGVHFTAQAMPEQIGHKALARPLSDIAAMAGTPTAALVTLGLPREFDPGVLDRVYAGMNALARRHQVAIAGGETTTSPGGMLLSISLIGKAPKNKVALRSGARAGHALFVTGELGGSLAGKHLDFEPRLEEARWLARHFEVGAMIDLSDGLAGDLRHVLNASKAGAELLLTSLPVSRAAKLAARNRVGAKTPVAAALTDGEDFELLFTVPSSQAVPLLDAWKKEFSKLRLTCIGRITTGPGIVLRDKSGVRTLNEHGYVHFK
jgi:thiamine-monophosphate kinase